MKKTVLLTVAAILLFSVTAGASTLKEAIVSGVEKGNAVIDISGYNVSPEEAMNTYFELMNTNEDFLFVSKAVKCTTKDNQAESLLVTYTVTKKEMEERNAAVDIIVSEIAEEASAAGDDFAKAKYVHDCLINTTSYDYTGNSVNVYDLFVNKKGVCGSYAFGYKMIMEKLGIPCRLVTSSTLNHMWNVVEIDGNWYNVDIAWDENYTTHMAALSSDNFLKSDGFFELLGHIDYISPVECVDTKYDMDI